MQSIEDCYIYVHDGDTSPLAKDLFDALGFSPRDCPRYRSTTISAIEPLICVTGRCGGGNRDDYRKEIEEFCDHDNFLREEDEEFDDTYADFYFQPDMHYWLVLLVRHQKLIHGSVTQRQPIWQSSKALRAFEVAEEDIALKKADFDANPRMILLEFLGSPAAGDWLAKETTYISPYSLKQIGHLTISNEAKDACITISFGQQKVELKLEKDFRSISKCKVRNSQTIHLLAILKTLLHFESNSRTAE